VIASAEPIAETEHQGDDEPGRYDRVVVAIVTFIVVRMFRRGT
jgi:hypothetical protein